ncbi:MltG/YceG/YrrL family protein [Sporosarcina gallistercoris]|uniref:Endolytic transglycosylase MltG n=1 Tax=Sporosarcina gallistercoris TaxID=2762245 RepID=A0ABR8PF76_9BACL|nr:hypothetical protein [Sporosarcina gallistercoris]MBD7906825.1 hypothetical protein [Sporosarcina gallistercoris]
MIRQLLQLIGVAFLTAGAVLHFANEPSSNENAGNASKDAQISELKQQLAEVKEVLADAQQPSQVAEETPKDPDKSEKVIKMILILSSGDTSKDASDSLEKSGIIQSAKEFEGYLTKNNLSGKIQIGKHEVDSSMDFAALAKELTTVKQ